MRNSYPRGIGYNRNFQRLARFGVFAFAHGVFDGMLADEFGIKHHVVTRKSFRYVFIGYGVKISNLNGCRRSVDFDDIIVEIYITT